MAEATLPLSPPLVSGNRSLADVTRDVCAPIERKPTGLWWTALAVASTALLVGAAAVAYQCAVGIGTWGLNRTVGWAFDITNFVFWIGIGHAGTLISAVLLLLRQKWRAAVNRSAEAMTLFAVLCAGLFPLIHLGRPWLAYWMVPYPNQRGPLWINFRSPLVWDFFAIGTYFVISLVFWYLGLIPDLATAGARARPGRRRRMLAWFSLGWNGSHRVWHRYKLAYLLLAGVATPLVVSVHTIVSFDFAATVLPGWHTTILPPYFVAGAIFSGMAMVLTLVLVARKVVHLEDYITLQHIDSMCKITLAAGWLVALAYVTEFFVALHSENPYEQFTASNRLWGPYGWCCWLMVGCNVVVPQLLWLRCVRHRPVAVFAIAILINVGMWFERFVIIVTSLHRDFLPSSWTNYLPTSIEVATLVGSFGLFFTCFLLFCRVLPMIAISEVKGVMGGRRAEGEGRRTDGGSTASRGRKSPGMGGSGRELSSRQKAVSRAKPQAAFSNPQSLIPNPSSHPSVLGAFQDEADLLGAAEALRAAGLKIRAAHTPYAVEGLDRVMGLARSRLGWAYAGFGLLGATLMFWFQHWTSAVDWPLHVGGKPWNSFPAYVPVTFAGAALAAGLGTMLTFLVAARLRPGKKATLPFPRVTDDQFALLVEPSHTTCDAAAVERLLEEYRAVGIQQCAAAEDAAVAHRVSVNGDCPDFRGATDATAETDDFAAKMELSPLRRQRRTATRRLNVAMLVLLMLLAGIALVLPRNLARPNREFLPDMAHSPAYSAQSANPIFPDGKTLQPPVAHTVARDELPLHYQAVEADAIRAGRELRNPRSAEDPRTRRRGAMVFQIFCATCHGGDGQANGVVAQHGYPAPPSLVRGSSTQMPDGQLFHIITYGRGNMPSHAGQVSAEDRWNAIAHIRSLQDPCCHLVFPSMLPFAPAERILIRGN